MHLINLLNKVDNNQALSAIILFRFLPALKHEFNNLLLGARRTINKM